MPAYILSLSDSRFRGIKDFFLANEDLHKFKRSTGLVVQEQTIPGGKIEDLLLAAKRCRTSIRRNHPSHRVIVLLSGGICNLTTKGSPATSKERSKHYTEIYYVPNRRSVDDLKKQLNDVIQLCKGEGWYLVLSTIPPADLAKSAQHKIAHHQLDCSSFTEEQLETQQRELHNTTIALNEFITERSVKEEIRLADLQAPFIRISTKKSGRSQHQPRKVTRLVTTGLEDGVHFDQNLRVKLFNIALEQVQALLPISQVRTKKDTDTETETETEAESYNFKRRKYDSKHDPK